jgi:1-acyl-sn-glycerol-3-phosphate acyltransferase
MSGRLEVWRQIRATVRLALCLGHVLAGMATVGLLFRFWQARRRAQAVRSWARCMLDALGVQLQVDQSAVDAAASTPQLLVCNHRSWLDILVLHACLPCRFVAKAEVHAWPLLGPMAAAAGTLFIERTSPRDALRVVHQMAAALQDGDVVAIFPEGTTGPGDTLMPFHANLFQAAVSTGSPVLPTAVRYLEGDLALPSQAPNFVGDESLVESLWRTACCEALVAQWVVGRPLLTIDTTAPNGHRLDRRSMAKLSHAAVSRLLRLDL